MIKFDTCRCFSISGFRIFVGILIPAAFLLLFFGGGVNKWNEWTSNKID